MKQLLAISSLITHHTTLNRVLLSAAVLALVGTSAAAASYSGKAVSAAQQVPGPAPEIIMQQSFEATGLPAGAATGQALRLMLPPGFNLKHAHGGPEYVYVIAGSITITDAAGSTTYTAGDFTWRPGGVVHTGSSPEGAELFVLSIRPVGAEWLIPAL